MTNTIIFFFALLLTYLTADAMITNAVNKKQTLSFDYTVYILGSIFTWSFLYYLTHTN